MVTVLAWFGAYFLAGLTFAAFDWLLVGRWMALRGVAESAALAWFLAWPLLLVGMALLVVREGLRR